MLNARVRSPYYGPDIVKWTECWLVILAPRGSGHSGNHGDFTELRHLQLRGLHNYQGGLITDHTRTPGSAQQTKTLYSWFFHEDFIYPVTFALSHFIVYCNIRYVSWRVLCCWTSSVAAASFDFLKSEVLRSSSSIHLMPKVLVKKLLLE